MPFRRSPLALAVLGVLEGGPLHPYGIQRRLKDWGKDGVVNVEQRSQLYKTITRLEEAGLITAQGTERDQRYPERTTYDITPEGREKAVAWMEEILSTPRNEYPEFLAALSFAPLVTPDALRALLVRRGDALAGMLENLDDDLPLPRVVLLDAELQRATLKVEIDWVRGVIRDLEAGTLTWTRQELLAQAAAYEVG